VECGSATGGSCFRRSPRVECGRAAGGAASGGACVWNVVALPEALFQEASACGSAAGGAVSVGVSGRRRKAEPQNAAIVGHVITRDAVNTQDVWLSGLCLSSAIPKSRDHNVSVTGSVSVR
jgi:hypothetical protein